MDETESIQTLIEYFEMNDGEIFGIQQVDPHTQEVYDQIVIERHIAIDIAKYILETFGENV